MSNNLKMFGVIIGVGMTYVAFQCFMANSSAGFTSTNLATATSGIRALMEIMMDWKSVIYVGIPTGILLFGICKLLNISFFRHSPSIKEQKCQN